MDNKKIEQAISDLLLAVGEDPNREGLLETPKRVANAYNEILNSSKVEIEKYYKTFKYEGTGLVLQNDIEFYSLCEHHLLPFFGKVHIAYLPNNEVIGLSKLGRITDFYSKNLQLQERLNEQIATSLMQNLNCKGVIVIIEANHMCMSMRGVKKGSAVTKTIVCRGIYETDYKARLEVINLLNN